MMMMMASINIPRSRGLLRMALLVTAATVVVASRSCTRRAGAILPCEDELYLERGDRFLLTLFGHSCYEIEATSLHPLDVFFYDPRSWRADRPRGHRRRLVLQPNSDVHVCVQEPYCREIRANVSARAVYEMVIARSHERLSAANTLVAAGNNRVVLRITNCEGSSPWFYAGLVTMAIGGFCTMSLLLCLIGEYILGLRPYTRLLRRKIHEYQFIELTQMDDDLDLATRKTETRDEAPEATQDLDGTTPSQPSVVTVVVLDGSRVANAHGDDDNHNHEDAGTSAVDTAASE